MLSGDSLDGLCDRGGDLGARQHAARRDPRSLRHAGHHLHRVSGPGAADGRGPGHLSAHDRDARRCRASKVVRGFSFSAFSFVYVIFEDGTDLYWARSRVLEYLNVASQAPAAGRHAVARPGRDRRRLGLQYVGRLGASARLAELRTHPGLVSALSAHQRPKASPRSRAIGGFVKQYQVAVDPTQAAAPTTSPLAEVTEAIRAQQQRCRRPRRSRWPRTSTWSAAAAICAASTISRRSRSSVDANGAPGAACATSPASSSGPTSAAASPS